MTIHASFNTFIDPTEAARTKCAEQLRMIEACLTHPTALTEWELAALQYYRSRIDNGKILHVNQAGFLNEIDFRLREAK